MESSKPSKTLQNRGGKLRKNISESEKKKENLTAGRMSERKCGKKNVSHLVIVAAVLSCTVPKRKFGQQQQQLMVAAALDVCE